MAFKLRLPTRTRTTALLVAFVTLVVFAVLVPVVSVLFVRNGERNLEQSALVLFPSGVSDGLTVGGIVTAVDPASSTARIRLIFKPEGSLGVAPGVNIFELASRDQQKPTTQINVTIDSRTVVFPPGIPMADQDVSTIIYGDIARYPFDGYTASIEFSATALVGGAREPIALQAVTFPAISSYYIEPTIYQLDGTTPELEFAYTIHRSVVTKAFSVFIMIMMWTLSLFIFALSVSIWIRDRKVEPPTMAVAGALLFALPALRNTQPGSPPIGALTDVIAFFWNMMLVSFSVVLLLLNYLIKYKSEKKKIGDESKATLMPPV